ncbi:hypothetical protein TNCV_2106651 [Trichonephila clavipes]|nr:hypothetical protein TNCV_2106651 [Trichonephila clavipes]
MSPEYRIRVIYKTTSICTNSSTTFAAVWILSSETMAEATLGAESQTGAFSLVGSMINLGREWRDILFSDESWLSLQHQDGRICIWRHRGERTLAVSIRNHRTGPSPGEMVWGDYWIHVSVTSYSH